MKNPIILRLVVALVLVAAALITRANINNLKNPNKILGEQKEPTITTQPSTTPIPTQINTPTPNEENKIPTEVVKEDTAIENNDVSIPSASYTYDPYYPIILSLSDNKGGIIRHSEYNQYSQGSSITGTTLKVGDTIHWKAEASDPKGRQILYNFHSNSQRFTDLFGRENGQYKYTINNEVEFTITEDDIKEMGEAFTVVAEIRSEKENYRTGTGGSDDIAYLDYKLSR